MKGARRGGARITARAADVAPRLTLLRPPVSIPGRRVAQRAREAIPRSRGVTYDGQVTIRSQRVRGLPVRHRGFSRCRDRRCHRLAVGHIATQPPSPFELNGRGDRCRHPRVPRGARMRSRAGRYHRQHGRSNPKLPPPCRRRCGDRIPCDPPHMVARGRDHERPRRQH